MLAEFESFFIRNILMQGGKLSFFARVHSVALSKEFHDNNSQLINLMYLDINIKIEAKKSKRIMFAFHSNTSN